MSSRRIVTFLIVVVALFGCRRSNSGQLVVDVPAVVALTVLGGGPVVFDPLATGLFLCGTLTLHNDNVVGTQNGDLDCRIDCPPECQPSETSVTLSPGQQRVVQIFTSLPLAAALAVTVVARYVLGTVERTFPVAWQNAGYNSRALALLTLISAPVFAILWFASTILAPIGVLTRNSNPLVPMRVPALAQEVRLLGAVIGVLTVIQLVALFGSLDGLEDGGGTFPPGQGPDGFTVAANPSATLADGEYITFWMSVSADVPLGSPNEFFQYAFVCDSDTDLANNYVPIPAFADDFFGGTDRWYELNYAPGMGWTLRCRVVGAGNSITTVPSGARAMINGDTIVMLVPRSEFVVSNPPFRATTFAHKGDFGQNPPYDWSGDPTPTVAEGLQTWQ